MSDLARLFLVVHVTMAVIMVGSGYVYPILMAKMKAGGSDRVPLTGVMKTISRGFTFPFIFIQPLSGLGLIMTTRDLWNPFEARNRWLFASIILFVIVFVLDTFVAGPAIKRMHAQAQAGQYDSAEFNRDIAMLSKVGPVFGILFITITVLMIWKPGAPNLHS